MNNKGQVLVVFVILLPILLLIFTFVVDVGLLSIEKRKISNNTYDAVEYYLENLDKEKTINLLNSNLEDIKIDIIDEDIYVIIYVEKNYKGIFNIIYDNKIVVKYKGNKETKEIIKG